jgi:hypothetical protein
MSLDPATTNPQHYTVVFEDEHTRVLEYTDRPGDRTTPHEHPDSGLKSGTPPPNAAAEGPLGPQ